MSEIINLNNNQEPEQHECETCDLVSEFVEYTKQAESEEELFEILHSLSHEAKMLGVKEYLISEVAHKIDIIEHLECGCAECDCEDE